MWLELQSGSKGAFCDKRNSFVIGNPFGCFLFGDIFLFLKRERAGYFAANNTSLTTAFVGKK